LKLFVNTFIIIFFAKKQKAYPEEIDLGAIKKK
jgi:hypothetical protein